MRNSVAGMSSLILRLTNHPKKTLSSHSSEMAAAGEEAKEQILPHLPAPFTDVCACDVLFTPQDYHQCWLPLLKAQLEKHSKKAVLRVWKAAVCTLS